MGQFKAYFVAVTTATAPAKTGRRLCVEKSFNFIVFWRNMYLIFTPQYTEYGFSIGKYLV